MLSFLIIFLCSGNSDALQKFIPIDTKRGRGNTGNFFELLYFFFSYFRWVLRSSLNNPNWQTNRRYIQRIALVWHHHKSRAKNTGCFCRNQVLNYSASNSFNDSSWTKQNWQTQDTETLMCENFLALQPSSRKGIVAEPEKVLPVNVRCEHPSKMSKIKLKIKLKVNTRSKSNPTQIQCKCLYKSNSW